jgi:ketosteroid isomerase-like protein
MRFPMLLGLLLLLSVVAPPTHAQTEAHNEVMQALEALRLAALAGDADKQDALMSDDCTLVVVSGRLITKPQYLSFVRGGMVVVDALTYEEVVIRVYGSTAVVTHVLNVEERIDGAAGGGRFRATRVLVKGDAGWRFVAFQSTAM